MKLARIYYKKKYGKDTKKNTFICLNKSFHGRSITTATATGQDKYKLPYAPLTPGFKHVDINDIAQLENAVDETVCGIILEPVQGESGVYPLTQEYAKRARELCDENDMLLIFDEVVTGFRIGPSGAQGYFGVDPDLTVFGKIIAGGYPGAGGVGGHADCMAHLGAGLDSSGKKIAKAMCGGTMAATPISCVAGYYALCEIEKRNACEVAGRMGDRLTAGLQKLIKKYDLPFVAFNQGSICHLDNAGTMHFSVNWNKPWTIPALLKETGIRQREMEHIGAAYMAEGIVTLAGSRLYTSAAYTEEMIDDVLNRFERVFANCGPLEIEK
jgi:glutamate-1-semialdehyde 2,1-aminomutase